MPKPGTSSPSPQGEQTPITVDDRPAHGAHGLEEYEEILPPPKPARPGPGRRQG